MNKKLQRVYIDDAGDPGFKLTQGSTSHFVIACVIFDDPLTVEEVALAIKNFKRKIGWNENREIKFNKTKKSIIKELLSELSGYGFRIRAICVDKSKIRSHELRSKQDSFYNYIIKEVLSATEDLTDADVRLDGHSGREYKRTAIAYFRKQINAETHKISRFRFFDSQRNNLIQLADLVAGSILRSTNTKKTDSGEYVAILKNRIEDIWYFE